MERAQLDPPPISWWVVLIAAFGLLVPNGLLIYWLVVEFTGLTAVLDNHLATAFILDALLTLVLLAYWFAQKPVGPVRWYWFVLLSLVGGPVFGLPAYWWLNRRQTRSSPT